MNPSISNAWIERTQLIIKAIGVPDGVPIRFYNDWLMSHADFPAVAQGSQISVGYVVSSSEVDFYKITGMVDSDLIFSCLIQMKEPANSFLFELSSIQSSFRDTYVYVTPLESQTHCNYRDKRKGRILLRWMENLGLKDAAEKVIDRFSLFDSTHEKMEWVLNHKDLTPIFDLWDLG